VPPVESLIQTGPASLALPALRLAMASLRLLQLKPQGSRPRMLLGIENLLLNKVGVSAFRTICFRCSV